MVFASISAAAPPASLRERQRRARCERILNAAEALVREGRSTDFSMTVLADRAQMSPTTPYNLFGSKAGILYALLERSMGEERARRLQALQAEPLERVLLAAQLGGGILAADPDFFRPLWRFLLAARDPVHRSALLDRALEWWQVSMDAARGAGLLAGVVDADELARELVIHCMGVLDLWVQDELSDSEFCAQLTFGTGLMLLPIADGAARAKLLAHMREAKAELMRLRRPRAERDARGVGIARPA